MVTRDTEGALIFGVCAGIAKHMNMSPVLVRAITVLSFIFTGSITFWLYIAAAILLPKEIV